MSKVKPCPFCGGPVVITQHPLKYWIVACDTQGCRAAILRGTEDDAIGSWNRRTHAGEVTT